MDKPQRIQLILRIRDALRETSWDDETLLLETFGVGERVEDSDGTISMLKWLHGSDDGALLALGQYLQLLSNEPNSVSDAGQGAETEPKQLFVFATHLSNHRKYLGEVEAALKQYAVTLFVAHDSIPMDAPWEPEIVNALNACHAGAVFVHPGIHQSFYCMQEAGWMLGRGIPIARLMFGESPKALLGAQQGRQCVGQSATKVAGAIIDWCLTHEALLPHVAESLATALNDSGGYSTTDAVWSRLTEVPNLSTAQLGTVLHAAEQNSQVFGTGIKGYAGRPYRELIAKRATEWDTEGVLTTRIAAVAEGNMRDLIDPEGIIPTWALNE